MHIEIQNCFSFCGTSVPQIPCTGRPPPPHFVPVLRPWLNRHYKDDLQSVQSSRKLNKKARRTCVALQRGPFVRLVADWHEICYIWALYSTLLVKKRTKQGGLIMQQGGGGWNWNSELSLAHFQHCCGCIDLHCFRVGLSKKKSSLSTGIRTCDLFVIIGFYDRRVKIKKPN